VEGSKVDGTNIDGGTNVKGEKEGDIGPPADDCPNLFFGR